LTNIVIVALDCPDEVTVGLTCVTVEKVSRLKRRRWHSLGFMLGIIKVATIFRQLGAGLLDDLGADKWRLKPSGTLG